MNLRPFFKRCVRSAENWRRRGRPGGKPSCFRRPVAEALEQRRLLFAPWTVTIEYSGSLANFTFEEEPGSTSDDVVILSLDSAGNLTYELSGSASGEPNLPHGEGPIEPPGDFPISEIGSIRVIAARGNDRLILDFTNGSPVPVEGTDFSDWDDIDDDDVIELTAYEAASIDVVHTGIESGTVYLDEGPGISYSLTESLILGGVSANLTIDLSQTGVANPDVAVADDGAAGFSALRGSTVAFSRFANPANSLTINLDNSAGADTVTIEGLDATFDADLTLRGGNDDTVRFETGPTDLGPTQQNLIVTAGTIGVHQELTVSGNALIDAGSDVELLAPGRLAVNGDGVLISAGDDVLIEGDVQGGNGPLSIVAGDDVVQTANVSTAGGSIFVSASNANSDAMNGIDMRPDATTTSGGANIRLAAVGESDILLGLVNAGVGSVSLLAERDILDNNGDRVNIQASRLRMEADANRDRTGQIGQPDGNSPQMTNAIDTQVTTLAGVSADGIYVLESDALSVDATSTISVDRVNSDFSFTTVTDSSLADLETTDAGSIVVQSRAGTVTVNDGDADAVGILAGQSGDVLLAAQSSDTIALIVPAAGGLGIVDGGSFLVQRLDGATVLASAIFEFDSDGGISAPGHVVIPFTPLSTADGIAQEIVEAIQNANLGLTPRNLGAGTVRLGTLPGIFVDASLTNLVVQVESTDGSAILSADMRSGSGDLSLVADHDVRQNASLRTGDGGAASVNAKGGHIVMSDGVVTTNATGPIHYRATGDVELSLLSSILGDIQVTADSDTDNAGRISDTTVAEDPNLVTAATVTLVASSGIGAIGHDDIDTTIDTIQAANGSSGDVVIHETNALVLGGAGIQSLGADGNISIRVDTGGLTVDSSITTIGSGDIWLVVSGDAILSGTSSRVATAGGQVLVDSNAAITMAKGSVVDAGGGDVTLEAEIGVLLGRIVSPGATVTIEAGHGGIADGADPADPPDSDGADIEAEAAVLHATGSVGSRVELAPWGTAVVSLDTKIERLEAVSAEGVGIFIVNDGPLVVDLAEAARDDPPHGIVDISTASPLTVAGVVRGTFVHLTAAAGLDGPTPDDNLTLLDGSMVVATAGDVTLCAGHAVIVDPLATLSSATGVTYQIGGVHSNSGDGYDVNGDGATTAMDALIVINDLNWNGARRLDLLTEATSKLDVSRDLVVSPLDVLLIINHLNRESIGRHQARPSVQSNSGAMQVAEAESASFAASVGAPGTVAQGRQEAIFSRLDGSLSSCGSAFTILRRQLPDHISRARTSDVDSLRLSVVEDFFSKWSGATAGGPDV